MLLAGRRALVLGVANKNSLAWAVAKAWHEQGAEVALTYQSERFLPKLTQLTEGWRNDSSNLSGRGDVGLFECDVCDDASLANAFARVEDHFEGGQLDLVLHAIAHAPPEAINAKGVLNIPRQAFLQTMDASAYSLIAVAQHARPLLARGVGDKAGGSILSLSFDAAEKVVPAYGFMAPSKAVLETLTRYMAHELGPEHVRVNCISAGPVNTLAARGIPGFRDLSAQWNARAPVGATTPQHVADTAVFLASDLARGITGQVIHVDGGASIVA